ncbi:MAG TPA: hypothetical protein VKA37_12760 [Halobacteriales archaeon]|nr:hypothetical protein [Halobacteriales archaeon]
MAGDDSSEWRSWFPFPSGVRGFTLGRWVLLDGNRYAVTGALLSLTFVAILAIGTVWTFEMQRLLTETQAVQTVLTAFLSGIILLVSIVVSINSIVLSYDITDVSAQRDRVEGTMEFRREVGRIADGEESPSDPNTFLRVMAEVIHDRAQELERVAEGGDEEFAREVKEYVESIAGTAEHLERSLHRFGGGEFGVLWLGLETDYGSLMNRSRRLTSTYRNQFSEDAEEHFDDLLRALELFATGREYFKTLYYGREISDLSRTLLVISLPAIIVTASTILAINAGLLPDVWVFGLPPLLTFVAVSFTVALAPFIVLTAYMLRVATVARRTASAGPFVLRS